MYGIESELHRKLRWPRPSGSTGRAELIGRSRLSGVCVAYEIDAFPFLVFGRADGRECRREP